MSGFILSFGMPGAPYVLLILIVLLLFFGSRMFSRPNKPKQIISPSSEPKTETPDFHRYTFLFPCEHCGNENQTTKDLIDTEQQCWSCHKTLIVPPDTGKAGKPIIPENEKQIAAKTTTDEPVAETKACPQCAEIIKFEAIKCRYCGSDLVINDNHLKLASDPSIGAGFCCIILGVVIGKFSPVLIIFSSLLFFIAFILSIVGMAKGYFAEGIAIIIMIMIGSVFVLPSLGLF